MSDWKQMTLAEVTFKVTDGSHHSPSEYKNGLPMFSVKDMRDQGFCYDGAKTISEADYYKLIKLGCQPEIDDILIAKDGSVLKHIFRVNRNPDYVLLSSIAIIRPNKNLVDPAFLVYSIKEPGTKDLILNNFVGGSGVPRIVLKDFKQIELVIPDLNTQKSIASILTSLDDKIDLLHRQNKTLEQMAETLFRQWFVVEAKEEWEEVPLSNFADFFNGKSRPKEEGLVPVYGGNGILGYANKSNYSGKSIIVGRVGAYCGSLYYENKDVWVSDNALLVKAKYDNATHFLFYLLKTLDLNSMAIGSSHPLLTQTLLKSIEIQEPPIDRIKEFDLMVGTMINKIEANQTQIRTLTAMRDSLLPKLMSGEVRVEEAM